jgi:hypothetical protein
MWVQIIYIGGTLLAFTVLMLTVHIRFAVLEKEVLDLRRRFDNSTASYGWTPKKKASLWAAIQSEENDHD